MLVRSYYDLCREISGLDERINGLIKERGFLERMMHANKPKLLTGTAYDNVRVQNYYSPYPLDEIAKRMAEIDYHLKLLIDLQGEKMLEKTKLEQFIREGECLEYRVAYQRDVERKPLYLIAEDLGYSYDWIRRISSRVKRNRGNRTQ